MFLKNIISFLKHIVDPFIHSSIWLDSFFHSLKYLFKCAISHKVFFFDTLNISRRTLCDSLTHRPIKPTHLCLKLSMS